MIDKFSIGIGLLAVGSRIIAQIAPSDLPTASGIANLTSTGAIIWLLCRVMPKMLSDHKEERASWLAHMSAELRELRSAFHCDKDK